MTLPVSTLIKPKGNAAPPESIKKLFQSGAISQEQVDMFFLWIDKLIKTGTTEELREKNAQELLQATFSPDIAREVAARIRTNPLSYTFSPKYDPSKKLTDYLKLDKPIVFYDLETDGVNTDVHKIIEISAIKIHPDGRVEGPITQKINPERPIPSDATAKHGIKDEDVKDKPTFRQVSKVFYEFFDKCHVGGFNILTFDNRILQKEFERAGYPAFDFNDKSVVDVMRIFHNKVKIEKGTTRKLTDAYKYYCGQDLKNAHQAEADILATVETLKGQFEAYPDVPREVNDLGGYCSNSTPDFVDPQGKFVWINNEVVFNFGKFRDKPLREVVETNRGYLEWMLSKDFPNHVKDVISNALRGQYPSQTKHINGNGSCGVNGNGQCNGNGKVILPQPTVPVTPLLPSAP